jgi:hypothetical protein
MKKICTLCGKTKWKRTCQLHENEAICPVCCATTRQQLCGGCRYYAVAQQYQASKGLPVSPKHFIAEINENVFNEVDRALILCEQGSFSEAYPILQKLLPAHPRNHQVYYGMGVYHCQTSYCWILKGRGKFSPNRVETVEYYREYSLNKKSYIQTLIQQNEKEIKSWWKSQLTGFDF